ncbi:MAG: ABC transporter substrate-binding protein [Spirochaetes bacterium]|nr:ABC transporter substrate-binding protein [Spirochaetota bacterium]
MRKAMALAVVLASILSVAAVRAAGNEAVPGVYDDKIVVGYTMPMSGPIGFMGSQTATTTETVFKKYNEQGGIYGRKLQLVKYDSGMDAGQALANYRKLILEDKVFCVLFGFGSFVRPAYSFFEEQKVPWLFPGAPSEDVMFPARKYLFSVFPTTATQMSVEVNWMIQQKQWKRLAVVYGDSASGKTGLDQIKDLLKGADLKLVAAEAIPINATSAAVQVAKVGMQNPDMVLIMVQMSLIGPTIPNLLQGVNIDGLYSAWWGALQWPNGKSTETKQMADLRALLVKEHPEIYNDSNVGGNVEHGLTVELFVEALKRAGKDLTREGLLKALESFKNYDNGKGNFVTFSPTRHEGIAGGFVIQYKNSDWLLVSKWIDVDVGQ